MPIVIRYMVELAPINQTRGDHTIAYNTHLPLGYTSQSTSPLYAIKKCNDRRYTMDDIQWMMSYNSDEMFQ